jgi:glycosyltransferase involved in cell wall biosynthesis
MQTRVCFIGGARYRRPLDATSEKKFRGLETLGTIYIVAFAHALAPERFTQHARFYLLPGLPLPILRYAEMMVIGSVVACWLVLRHDIGILVAQSPYEGVAAAWVKKVAGWFGRKVRLVVESHGDFEECLFLQRKIPLPRLYRFLMRRAAGYSLRRADVLRAISGCTARQLESWLPGKPIVQFPTWTDIEVFLETGSREQKTSWAALLHADSRTSLKGIQDGKAIFQFPAWTDIDLFLETEAGETDDSPQLILYVGVLTPLKGVHHLIAAFAATAAELHQTRLVIIGHEANRSYALKLKAQVKSLDMSGRVQFLGAMPQEELARWMQKARVCVLPSTSEGLGRVLVESMATGTPVIGSNVGGVPEIVKDNVTGFLVPPSDETALAERLRWLLEHPGEAVEMGRHARAFAQRFFSTESYVDGYREIFEGVRVLVAKETVHETSTL